MRVHDFDVALACSNATHKEALLFEMCVCALHNAAGKVSGLIFYLSGLITSAFTAALLWPVEDTASLLNLLLGGEEKKKAINATAADA